MIKMINQTYSPVLMDDIPPVDFSDVKIDDAMKPFEAIMDGMYERGALPLTDYTNLLTSLLTCTQF